MQIFHGRKWLAAYEWVLGLLLVAVTVSDFLLGWPAVLLMGVPALGAAYACFTFGIGEAVARVELRGDGFALRLPRYRGYLPFLPVQRLDAKWTEVTALRRRYVRARIIGIRFDYIAHRIETRHGAIMLFEPLPNDFFRNTRGTGLNLPARQIAEEFSRRAGRFPHDDGEIWGGGLWRNMVLGGVELWPSAAPPPSHSRA